MKYKFINFLVLLAPLIFLSCKKEQGELPQLIVGTWELRIGFNGQGGVTNYAAGNGPILIFTATGYEINSGGRIIKSGTYTLVKDTSYIMGKTGDRIIYDNEQNSVRNFVEVTLDTLNLLVDAYDGPSALYVRIK